MSLLLWLLVVPIVIGVALINLACWYENKVHSEAPQITWTEEDMEKIAKLKKDEEMTEEEFNIKYGAMRHEWYRTGVINKRIFNILQKILYWIELNIIHGGESNLHEKIKILKPIFIIGDFRSGTSVLERLITHHPDICAFDLTENFVWTAPKLWNLIVSLIYFIRYKNGHNTWLSSEYKGVYMPHSSNNRLNRNSAFELEVMWKSCQVNMQTNRNFNWNTLDDPNSNQDNHVNNNSDVLTYEYNDPLFERKLKNVICMLLLHHNRSRFINKNPLNGFRIGYLKKLFPDSKFIFISRDPIRTLESQLLMHNNCLKSCYVNEEEFRINNMKPKIPSKQELINKYNNKHWAYLCGNVYPNDHTGELMTPRIFPRTYPEHLNIMKYIKKSSVNCAWAMAIKQHERIAIEQFNDSNNNFEECKNLLTIYHEDLIDDSMYAFEIILQFLELKSTKEQRLKWLKEENFRDLKIHKNIDILTQTHSNTIGISGIIINEDTKEISKPHPMFKEETQEIMQILQPCIQRFNNRKPLYHRIKEKGMFKNIV
jgi:hypothetical protein